jgi:hypothetical protein
VSTSFARFRVFDAQQACQQRVGKMSAIKEKTLPTLNVNIGAGSSRC